MHSVQDAQALALRYAQIVDNRTFDTMRELLVDDFTQRGPEWLCESADAFVGMLNLLADNYSATFHLVGNQLGEWQGDCYEGETYCIASHIYEKAGQGRKLDMGIRYQEQVVYAEGASRYARRDVTMVWTSDHPLDS